ncbi:uncharacterized protein dok3 [Cololabis saira]|uniref:uncharacterized protein dok3 n=1 Tax=Cololabis saira TaxID=129043 RepID=UPI002AD48D18|nr:uncharacterized protein dok3 [Cololabis saira]
MDVVYKEGMLYLQNVKFGKRTWRKIWMLLFKPSSTGVGRLEFYNASESSFNGDQIKAGRKKPADRKVVRLCDFLSVTPAAKEPSCPAGCTAFYLKTMQCTYTFASTDSQDWLGALSHLAFQRDPWESGKGDFEEGKGLPMEDNELYSSWKKDQTPSSSQYQVRIQRTEAAKRCKLAGQYLVSPDSDALVLLSIKTGGVIFHWPYRLLRKFGQVEGGFSIEAGRRCESGEGWFTFLTPHGPQIFQAISRECSIAREMSAKPPSAHRPSFPDTSAAAVGASASDLADHPVYSLPEVPADTDYQSVSDYRNDTIVQNMKRMSLFRPDHSGSRESLGSENEAGEERCTSLETVNVNNITEEQLYDNVRKATAPFENNTEAYDSDDSIYADVKLCDSLSDLHTQIYSRVQHQPVPPNRPLTLTKSDQCSEPRLQTQHLPTVDSYSQSGYLRRAVLPSTRRTEAEYSESIYSDVKKRDSFSALPPQLYSCPKGPPDVLAISGPWVQPKPPSQHLPTVDVSLNPDDYTEAQAVDDLNDVEEEAASAAAHNKPSEAPGSFKHRLAEIISKDLAKFQPALPYGADINS